MKAYVLSLPRDVERFSVFKRELAAHLPGCQYEIPEMYDATGYSDAQLSRVYDRQRAVAVNGREIGRREIGCILSQQWIYEHVIANGSPFGLVFEDDVKLSSRMQAAFPHICDWFSRRVNEPTVLLLSQASAYRQWTARPLGDGRHRICKPLSASGNYGYMLNPLAAKRLLAYNRPISHHPDAWKTYQEKGVIRLYAVLPYLAGNYDFDRRQSNLAKERLAVWQQANTGQPDQAYWARLRNRLRGAWTGAFYRMTGVTVVNERTNALL